MYPDNKHPSSNIEEMKTDDSLKKKTREWMNHAARYKYTYGFTWMGVPIIQQPQDVMAFQEIIWKVKPDLIVETGIAHGGSLLLSASLLELMGGERNVIGIDIDIRAHTREAIEKNSLSKRIRMIEGSAVEKSTVDQFYDTAGNFTKALLILDSNHTHEHVLNELLIYSETVKKGSYIIVCDTRIEDCPVEFFKDRPWGTGNNPKTAVHEFLEKNDRFVIDKHIPDKLLITANPDGYLKCIKD
ncbi:MAG: CmcI family methyltransferase [Desulfobacteraceae bacterium]|jgi:cephalosporin hydroxylase|nr:CmcI family methyltransferase [Desulfobacteraceae bacterium]